MAKLPFTVAGLGILSLGLAAQAGRAVPAQERAKFTAGQDAHASWMPPAAPVATRSSVTADTVSLETLNQIVHTICFMCHNDQLLTGNMSVAGFDVGAPHENADLAERMIRKLRAGMMPPPGAPRPQGDTLLALAQTLERRIDAHAAKNPNPGRRIFQRLNRAEYESSIRDLVGLQIDAAEFLPLDTKSANFDNIADVQMPSATLMQGYLRAADHISRLAVGDPNAAPTSTTYKVPKTASQLERVDGAPFGTRGGVSTIHNFPADGEYIFRLEFHPGPTGFLYGLTTPGEILEVSIDGERAALVEIDRWMDESDPNGMRVETAPVPVRAGPHRVTAAFITHTEGPVDDLITPVEHTLADAQIGSAYGVTTVPHLRDLVIVGPYDVTGVSDTPSRRAIFTCRPTAPERAQPCAEAILTRMGERAYRRPLDQDDLGDLLGFYQQGEANGRFEEGIRTALQAMLTSPHFLFRLEEVPANATPGAPYRISDVALASRLSFFLWARPPDAELIQLAQQKRLSKSDVLQRQVRRMLADPRSQALASRFAAQWLRLPDLEKLHPDAQLFPYYDHRLAEAMARETELFFHSLIQEDRGMLDLLTADYTFVNERLASHYGFPGITGSAFQRIDYPDDRRRGLLGHGSILALTSHADRTSPVLRGKWVMEVLLGTPPPPPPPGVPDLEATEGAKDGRMLTTRERMEMHRSNPVCRSCHQFMDPIGLALDNFDVTGRWRIKENGMPLDTRGELYDGTAITNPDELRQALLSRPEALINNFTANLLAYALGRRVEYYDMPAVRAIARDAAEHGNKMTAFIMGVVNSPAFLMSGADQVTTDSDSGQ